MAGFETSAALPQVMGVVNVTPDSFSDGGLFVDAAAAVRHGLDVLSQGADVLDVGGESTRPGADAVSEADELDRVIPVIEGLRAQTAAPISVDTMKPAVARAAMAAGATIWNDVSALRFAPEAADVAAELGGPVVLMHMQGLPKTMQVDPHYDDVVAEVGAFLADRAGAALSAGVARDNIWVDPGVGFGKTLAHNLALMARLADLKAQLGYRLVFGASRKRFVHALDASAAEAGDRLGGSLAAVLWAGEAGADMVRVHDVRETAQALKVWRAIAKRSGR